MYRTLYETPLSPILMHSLQLKGYPGSGGHCMVEPKSLRPPTPNLARRGPSFWWGLMALALLTAIWGYCNIVIRQLEFTLNPAVFLIIRYLLGGLVGLPVVLLGPKLHLKHAFLGLGAGFLLASATLSQALGMKTIPVDNVAFITALYVVFTPLAMALWRRRRPHRIVGVAVIASLAGVLLLVGHVTLAVATGTFWSLLAALWATFQIIATAELSRSMTTMQLTIMEALGAGFTLTIYAVVSMVFFHTHMLSGWSWHAPIGIWWRLGYLSILGTLVAGWLQVWGQRRLSATEAALAFNMEPVWTAVFAWMVLSQGLTWMKLLGAALIIAGLVALSVKGEESARLEVPDTKIPYREH